MNTPMSRPYKQKSTGHKYGDDKGEFERGISRSTDAESNKNTVYKFRPLYLKIPMKLTRQ